MNKLYTLSVGIVQGSVIGAVFGVSTGTILSKFEKSIDNKVDLIEKMTFGGFIVGGVVGSFVTNTPLSACIVSSFCVPYYLYNKRLTYK